jgi:ADP-ribose pyrophosphatase
MVTDIDFELPDGRRETYAVTNAEVHVVCVLALTSDQRVVLARQFRPGQGKVLDELPGGRVDPGETTEAAAVRELAEETGFVAAKLVSLGIFPEGAYSGIVREGFLALGCERREEQKLDSTEFIEIVLKPLPDFLAQIRRGDATDCPIAWSGLFEAGLVSARVK